MAKSFKTSLESAVWFP